MVALDLETHDADRLFHHERGSYVRLAGVGDRTTTDMESVCRELRDAESIETVNGSFFDLIAMDIHHGVPVEETIPKSRDMRIAAFLNDPPCTAETKAGPNFKPYNLDAMAERYLGIRKSTKGKELVSEYGGWGNIPTDDPRFVEYCATDVDVTRRLAEVIPDSPYERREMEIAAITARARINGVRLDVRAAEARLQRDRDRNQTTREMLASEYGLPLDSKAPHRTKLGKAAIERAFLANGFRLDTWPRNKDGSLTVSKEVLDRLEPFFEKHPDHPARPVVDAIRSLNGTRSNTENLLRYRVGDRVHSTFEPFQSTGRWSVTEPSLITIKKKGAESERQFLVADEPDWVVWSVDMDQVDARCVAAHSQDHGYIDLIEGSDLHSEVALAAFGTRDRRQDAKALGHGWNYGRTPRGMARSGMNLDTAIEFDRGMRQRFPRIPEWQDRVRRVAESGEYLDNGWGRKLRAEPERAFTQAPGLVGQSCTRDLMAEGMLDMKRRAPEILSYLRCIIHDEFIFSTPLSDAFEVANIVRSCLTRRWAPNPGDRPVLISAGKVGDPLKVGHNWLEVADANMGWEICA